jgi:hypothetical protein
MPKQFYTERDIEQMVSSGTRALTLNDNVVLTEQAYEAARRLGMALLRDRPDAPPSAPVRPYLSAIPAGRKPSTPSVETQDFASLPTPTTVPATAETQNLASLQKHAGLPAGTETQNLASLQKHAGLPAGTETQNLASLQKYAGSPTAERIRAAVVARLGDSVDPALLNTIIHRVLESTGVK